MENGFLRVPRFFFSSPAWKTPRRFSTFEAYLDLLQCAAWRHLSFFHKGIQIPIEPGEFITSSNRLAQRWGWSRDDVRKWLRHLAEAKILTYTIVEGALKVSLDGYCNSRFSNLPDDFSAEAETKPPLRPAIPEAAPQHAASCVNELVDAIIRRAPAAPPAPPIPAILPPRVQPDAELETKFPDDFPMEEFRVYLEKIVHPHDGRPPYVHRGWIAEMRDKFLQERAAEQAKREAESSEQRTAEPKVDQSETKQAA